MKHQANVVVVMAVIDIPYNAITVSVISSLKTEVIRIVVEKFSG